MLCFEWQRHGEASMIRLTPEEYRDRPASFRRDMNLKFGKEKIPLFLLRHKTVSSSPTPQTTRPAPTILKNRTHRPKMSVVKSNLQKAIRRGRVNEAVASAAYILAEQPSEILRRLPIILVEDVREYHNLEENFPALVWLMLAESQGYVLTQEDELFVLQATARTALPSPFDRESLFPIPDKIVVESDRLEEQGEKMWPDVSTRSKADTLAWACWIRASYGGMNCDVSLCNMVAAARLLELGNSDFVKESHPDGLANATNLDCSIKQRLDTVKMIPPGVERPWIEPASNSRNFYVNKAIQDSASGELASHHQLPCAVDFHCSPEICAFAVRHIAQRSINCANVHEDSVKKWIWITRSGINFRKPKPDLNLCPTWWDQNVNTALDGFARSIWSKQMAPKVVENKTDDVQQPPQKKRQVSLMRFFGTTKK